MSRLATCEAMKPAAPVIRMFLGVYEEAIKFPGDYQSNRDLSLKSTDLTN